MHTLACCHRMTWKVFDRLPHDLPHRRRCLYKYETTIRRVNSTHQKVRFQSGSPSSDFHNLQCAELYTYPSITTVTNSSNPQHYLTFFTGQETKVAPILVTPPGLDLPGFEKWPLHAVGHWAVQRAYQRSVSKASLGECDARQLDERVQNSQPQIRGIGRPHQPAAKPADAGGEQRGHIADHSFPTHCMFAVFDSLVHQFSNGVKVERNH